MSNKFKTLIKKYNEGKLKEVSEMDAIFKGIKKFIRIYSEKYGPIYLEEKK